MNQRQYNKHLERREWLGRAYGYRILAEIDVLYQLDVPWDLKGKPCLTREAQIIKKELSIDGISEEPVGAQ